jgi:glutamyl-tRNA synthetase
MNEARTRFAPSPTGLLHVGATRTALFAWLIAKQTNGKFVLRIEDTDRSREMKGAEQHIMDSLVWLGLRWDEGPDIGGKFGPYRQSERLDIYKQWAQNLIDSGRAYADPFSIEELDYFRKKAKSEKRPFLFRDHRPEKLQRWDGRTPLRFKSEPKSYKWRDEVMGELYSGPEVIDDFILIKSDGFPTYNFAHIVDDCLMEITHVIRSQEFISSVPKYLNLYNALGLHAPIFATLPYVLGRDGKKKLSKRDGAKDILEYAAEGYLNEAMFNHLGTLGWNDGTTKEIFSKDEIIKQFRLDRVQRGGAKFDQQRLTWINGYYIRQLTKENLLERVNNFWPPAAVNYPAEYKLRVLSLIQERLKFFSEIPELTKFFFEDLPVNLDLVKNSPTLKDISSEELHGLLEITKKSISTSDFSPQDLTNKLNNLLKENNQEPSVLFSLIRIVTTWTESSPGLADSLAVLGKNATLRRLTIALNNI